MSCSCPPSYPVCIYQGAPFSQPFQATDSAGDPLDLTGWTILSDAIDGDNPEAGVLFSFTIEETDLSTGQFALTLTAEETAEFTFTNAKFDVLFIDPDGNFHYWLTGCATLRTPITLAP